LLKSTTRGLPFVIDADTYDTTFDGSIAALPVPAIQTLIVVAPPPAEVIVGKYKYPSPDANVYVPFNGIVAIVVIPPDKLVVPLVREEGSAFFPTIAEEAEAQSELLGLAYASLISTDIYIVQIIFPTYK